MTTRPVLRYSVLIFLASALSLFIGNLAAEIRLDEQQSTALVASAPGLAQYPAAGALILYQGKRLRVLPGGAMELTEHLLVKVLQDRGRGFGGRGIPGGLR